MLPVLSLNPLFLRVLFGPLLSADRPTVRRRHYHIRRRYQCHADRIGSSALRHA